jgi:DNA-binding transcriptional MerR regulator
MKPQLYSIAEAARQIGVSAITLKRWLLDKKVEEVARDRNHWRVFTDADVRRIKAFADKRVPPKDNQ